MRLKIEKLVYGGSGLAFLDKVPVFVPMTVPGDEVECEIVREAKGYKEARATRVVNPSANRVVPKCEYFGRCGGCQWQHIDYAAQILWKQLIVEEQLSRIGKLKDPYVLPTVPSPKVWNYRGRVKLHKGDGGRRGFYAMGTNDLVEIKECLIADIGKENGDVFFTQVNPAQNENLKKLVAERVKAAGAARLLELYCGNGNLTFAVAGQVELVSASDSDGRAIAWAAENNKRRNVSFEKESALDAIKRGVKGKGIYDTLLVDPPRDGCRDVLKHAVKAGFKSIIYVSCDPSTLARDVKELSEHGYKLVFCQPLDMFPQTYHIETLAVMAA